MVLKPIFREIIRANIELHLHDVLQVLVQTCDLVIIQLWFIDTRESGSNGIKFALFIFFVEESHRNRV